MNVKEITPYKMQNTIIKSGPIGLPFAQKIREQIPISDAIKDNTSVLNMIKVEIIKRKEIPQIK